MTTIEGIIQIIKAHETKTFTKDYVIDLLKSHIALEQLNLDIAFIKGEQTQINKTHKYIS